MKRFPVLHAYHSFLQFIAFALMLAGFIVGLIAAQSASSFYIAHNPNYSPLSDILLKVAVFTAVYGISLLICALPLVFAEGVALRLSLEDHLYYLRHRDDVTLLPGVVPANRVNRMVSQRMAGIFGREVAAPPAPRPVVRPATIPQRAEVPVRQRTGKTGNLPELPRKVTTGKLSTANLPLLKREVLPGKPKTAPFRTGEIAAVTPSGLTEEATDQVREHDTAALIQPATTIRTQEMVALSKQSKTLRDPTASYNFRKAVEQFEAEKFPVAIQYLDKALAIDPAYANAYRLRAACYRRMDDTEHARKDMAMYQQYSMEQIPQ